MALSSLRGFACLAVATLVLGCSGQDRDRTIGWREHRIDDSQWAVDSLRGADGLALGDLDDDGREDVVSVHEDSDHLRIAFGTSRPTEWDRRTLDAGNPVAGIEDVILADVDADGRDDVVVAAESGRVAVYYCPPAPRSVQAWTDVTLPGVEARGSWIRVAAADFDRDGHVDILATNKAAPGETGTYSVFRHSGSPRSTASWTEQVLAEARFPINAQPLDVDTDGDMDVLAASWGERSLYFLENRGRGDGWSRHVVYSGRKPMTIGFMMAFGDVNDDGRPDVISGTGPRWEGRDEITWFEQPADPEQPWRPHFLGTIHPDKATGLLLVDLNDDEVDELFVGSYSWEPWDHEPENPSVDDPSGRLAWFAPPEDPTKPWVRHDISRRRRGMYDQFVAHDVNEDGLVDIVTTRGNSGRYDGVLWLEQRRGPTISAFERARATDSPTLPVPDAE